MKNKKSWLKIMDWAHATGDPFDPHVHDLTTKFGVTKTDWENAKEDFLDYFPKKVINEIDDFFEMSKLVGLEGSKAYEDGLDFKNCPYDDYEKIIQWEAGWLNAKGEDQSLLEFSNHETVKVLNGKATYRGERMIVTRDGSKGYYSGYAAFSSSVAVPRAFMIESGRKTRQLYLRQDS